MSDSEALTWRKVVDKHHSALVDELAGRLDSELEAARVATSAEERDLARSQVEAAREQTARQTLLSITESLNQSLRRIRLAPSQAAAMTLLLESTAPYAQQAVVLRVENNHARSAGVRGAGIPEDRQFAFALESAPAIGSVVENREPVVALASPGELTADLSEGLASGDSSRRAYLFPVVSRQEVVGVLIASGEPAAAALELLSEATGMRMEALDAERPATLKTLPGSELVQIAPPSVPESSAADRLAWSDLPAQDQRLHLQAQRVARVKVAEMRLYHPEELRQGVFDGNIYHAMRSEIDQARAEFLNTFLSKSTTMVDYLHLEILRSLAHEDDRLLGAEYPGPMV